MPRASTVLRLAALALLVAFLVRPQSFAPVFAPLTQYGAPPIYDQGNLLQLALAQLGTVCLAATLATPLVVAEPAGAASPVFVSANGSDSNPCSASAPCATITHALTSAPATIARMFASKFACVSFTPFGSPVEPDVYCRKAMSSLRA